MATGNKLAACVEAYMGSTGSGKTTRMVKSLTKKNRKRTLIWSPKEVIDNYAGLYPGSVVCTTATEVHTILATAGKTGPFHVVFKPKLVRKVDEANFHAVCKFALAVGHLAFVADELHTVTRPSWAPDGWSELVMMGRGFGVDIFGLSQRPASMDKDFLGNTSLVNVGRLSHPDDATVVAKGMGLKPQEIANLTGFMWIERNTNTGKVTRG